LLVHLFAHEVVVPFLARRGTIPGNRFNLWGELRTCGVVEGDSATLQVGKVADFVVSKPALFGAKPEMVVRGGFIAWANMGDPNASIPTPQPTFYRPQCGAHGKALTSTSITFVSAASRGQGHLADLGLARRLEPVQRCRQVGKRDMVFNDALPKIEVDPETYTVKADGRILTCEPAKVLPMAQRYFLF